MEPKILEEIQEHYKQELIEYDWEPIRRQPLKDMVSFIPSSVTFCLCSPLV